MAQVEGAWCADGDSTRFKKAGCGDRRAARWLRLKREMWQAVGIAVLVLFTALWGRVLWCRLCPGPEDDFDAHMSTGFLAWTGGAILLGIWWALISRWLQR